MDPDKAAFIVELAPFLVAGCIAITLGWVATTWLRIKHGYPLEGSWGNKIEPTRNREDESKIKLLGQENSELRDELAATKDRLAVIERIVTDNSYGLTSQIEALRDSKEKVR